MEVNEGASAGSQSPITAPLSPNAQTPTHPSLTARGGALTKKKIPPLHLDRKVIIGVYVVHSTGDNWQWIDRSIT